MDLKALKEIGLTDGETRVYLALIKLGETTTGPLATKAKVSSSKVYKILDRLESKGLVGQITKSKTKHFRALEPKRILDYLEEKEKQVQERKQLVKQLLPQLEYEHKQSTKKTNALVVQGFKAITNFYNNILDELKKGETYYVLSAGYGADLPGVRVFFHDYHKRRAKKGIILKMLADYNTIGNLVSETSLGGNIRYLPPHILANMSIVFYKNKSFIFFLNKDPSGFLIESKEVMQGFKTYFDALWKISKKTKPNYINK